MEALGRTVFDDLTLEGLAAVEDRAIAEEDGHLSIFRFTTGWKAVMGTPGDLYAELDGPAFGTLTEALLWARHQGRA